MQSNKSKRKNGCHTFFVFSFNTQIQLSRGLVLIQFARQIDKSIGKVTKTVITVVAKLLDQSQQTINIVTSGCIIVIRTVTAITVFRFI